jgi:cell division protein FtsL
MKSFERRKKLKNLLHSKFVLFILLIVAVFLAKTVWNAYDNSRFARENLRIANMEKEELENRIGALQLEIDQFHTEAGIEEALREKFGVAREGEEAIILIEDAELNPELDFSGGGFWSRIKSWFR